MLILIKEPGITFFTPQYLDRSSPTFTDLRSNRTLKTIPGFTVWPNKGALFLGLCPHPRERSLCHAIARLWEHGVTAQRLTVCWLLQEARSVMAFCRAFCTDLRSRKEADSPFSWLVCFCAFFIIALTLGTALNFGILFPVLMDYFHETRERTGK